MFWKILCVHVVEGWWMTPTGRLPFALWSVVSLSKLRRFSGNSEGHSVPWRREPGTWGLLSSRLPSVHYQSDLGHLSNLGQSPHLWDIYLGTPRAPGPLSLSALTPVMGILEGESRSALTRPVPVDRPRGWARGRVLPEGPRSPGDEGHSAVW